MFNECESAKYTYYARFSNAPRLCKCEKNSMPPMLPLMLHQILCPMLCKKPNQLISQKSKWLPNA